jgi:hypothetical protein
MVAPLIRQFSSGVEYDHQTDGVWIGKITQNGFEPKWVKRKESIGIIVYLQHWAG